MNNKDLNRFIDELIGMIKDEEKVLEAFLNHLNQQKRYLLADQIEEFQSTVDRQDPSHRNHVRRCVGRAESVEGELVSTGGENPAR
jgi:hypothetical protein